MRIERSSGIQKCPICMRKKKEAIDEQAKTGTACDVADCPFRDAIEDAIEAEREKHKVTFGSKTNKFTFGSKTNKFTFGKNNRTGGN